MKALSALIIVAMTFTMAGCFEDMSTEGKTAATGALVGAAVGGVIGSKSANAGKGILIGAAAGAAGGYLVGKVRASKEEGQASTVECPFCKETNIIDAEVEKELSEAEARGEDILIQCHSCSKEFMLQ